MKRAVIIGSGMGGLVSAILLARDGWKVTVLEQHSRPGGFLHRFFRQGLAYDTGFHYCGTVRPGQILQRCLAHLGVYDKLEFLPLDPDGFDEIWFPGLRFRVPVGREAYAQRLVETFPHEADGIRAVMRQVQAITEVYGAYTLHASPVASEVLRWESTSLEAFLSRHIRDPHCRAVIAGQSLLYGVPPDEAPAGLHAIVLDHFLQGACGIRGGGDRLAMTLVRRIRALGGEVLLRRRATAIEVVDRAARAVVTEDGEAFPADLVVADIHPRLLAPMLPEHSVRPAWRKRVERTRVGHAHLGVYLEIEGGPTSLGNRNHYRHLSWDLRRSFADTSPDDVPFYFATAPHERLGAAGPRGVVLMLLPLAYERVARWRTCRDEAYRRYKDALARAAVDALLADHPGLAGRIRRVEASTPITTERFTLSPRGAMYGHYHSVDQMGRYRPSQATRVRGLVLVGQGVFFPGVLGATLSAYYGCGHVLGLERLIEELRAQ